MYAIKDTPTFSYVKELHEENIIFKSKGFLKNKKNYDGLDYCLSSRSLESVAFNSLKKLPSKKRCNFIIRYLNWVEEDIQCYLEPGEQYTEFYNLRINWFSENALEKVLSMVYKNHSGLFDTHYEECLEQIFLDEICESKEEDLYTRTVNQGLDMFGLKWPSFPSVKGASL